MYDLRTFDKQKKNKKIKLSNLDWSKPRLLA